MTGTSRWAAGVLGFLAALAAARPAEEAAKGAGQSRPPWQRYLQGDDARKAAEQERQVVACLLDGDLEEALKAAEGLADLRRKEQGADHWQAVNARWLAVGLRSAVGQGEERQKEYASLPRLARQAATLASQKRYKESQALHEKILAIRRKVLGEEHPDLAHSYSNVAFNLESQGKFREAEEVFRKALAVRGKLLDREHPAVAGSYTDLAVNLYSQGKYALAEEGYRKGLDIFRKVLGEEHPSTLLTYNNLAADLHAQAKHPEAEVFFRKALLIQRKVRGEEHPETAASYNNLAMALQAQGKYAPAGEGLRKALAIFRKVLGEEHPATAMGYNNVAGNLQVQGKYALAEEGFRKALAIQRKVLGEEHADTATTYNNLATNLAAQAKYALAEEDYVRALAIRRKVLGEEHPLTAQSYNNLALNRTARHKYAQAEEGNRKALAIRRKVLGEAHTDTAQSYNNLAGDLADQGKYAAAEEGLRKALDIHRTLLGAEHPFTAQSYHNLACSKHAQGNYAKAEELWRRAAEIFARARLAIAGSGLERVTRTSERSPLPLLAAVLARNGKPEEAWQRFEESLARGTWDDVCAALRRPAAERARQAQIAARIDRLNRLLDETTTAGLSPRAQSERRDELLTQLRQALDELADFTRRLEKTYGPVAGQVFGRDRIQAALPPDAALVGWLDIPVPAHARDPGGEHWAVLLRPSGDPLWVRLPGSGDKGAWTDADTRLPGELRSDLQSARGQWQPHAERLRRQRLQPLSGHLKGVRHLIVLPSTALAGVPVEVIAEGYTVSYAHSGTMVAHLRRQPAVTGKGLLVLADPVFDAPRREEKAPPLPPAGVLLTGVLPGSNAARAGLRPNDVLLRYDDRPLAEVRDLDLSTKASSSDRLVPVVVWREGKQLSRPLFVQPGQLGVVVAEEPAPQAVAEQRRLDRRLISRDGAEGRWDRLPGTRVEASALERLFADEPTSVILDSQASEQRLDELADSGELGKYRYLHLATHGEVDNTSPLRSALILSRDRLPGDSQRAELLLAGRPIPDGRLTADEVLRRWSLHCDLVTLSACQTALGKYEQGEGFVGFAQALILAGSRSVCLGLWKVDDTATALLMERFYQNLLGKRQGLNAPLPRAEALAEARAWLRNLPREEAARQAARLAKGVARGKGPVLPPLQGAPATADAATRDHPFAHPYYWAAFVLVGHAD